MDDKIKVMSMDPEDFLKSGFLDDTDVEFTQAEFCIWDYDGKGGPNVKDVLALRVTLKDMDSGDEMENQYWSAGDAANFAVLDENGDTTTEAGPQFGSFTKEGVHDSSNIFHFFRSLVACGFKRELLVDFKAPTLIGLQAHVVQDAAPNRPGLKQEPAQGGRERTILVVNKIIRMPGEKTKRKATTKKAVAKKVGATATTDAGGGDDDTTALGVQVIAALLETEGGVVPFKHLKVRAIKYMAAKKLAEAPQRNPISTMVSQEDWLVSNGFLVADGSVMSAE